MPVEGVRVNGGCGRGVPGQTLRSSPLAHRIPSPCRRSSRSATCARTPRVTAAPASPRATRGTRASSGGRARGGACLAGAYRNGREKLPWRCANAHALDASWTKVRGGQWCPYCLQSTGEAVCRVVFEAVFGAPFVRARPAWLRSGEGTRLELDGWCAARAGTSSTPAAVTSTERAAGARTRSAAPAAHDDARIPGTRKRRTRRDARSGVSVLKVEMPGFEPGSAHRSPTASTCVSLCSVLLARSSARERPIANQPCESRLRRHGAERRPA